MPAGGHSGVPPSDLSFFFVCLCGSSGNWQMNAMFAQALHSGVEDLLEGMPAVDQVRPPRANGATPLLVQTRVTRLTPPKYLAPPNLKPPPPGGSWFGAQI